MPGQLSILIINIAHLLPSKAMGIAVSWDNTFIRWWMGWLATHHKLYSYVIAWLSQSCFKIMRV